MNMTITRPVMKPKGQVNRQVLSSFRAFINLQSATNEQMGGFMLRFVDRTYPFCTRIYYHLTVNTDIYLRFPGGGAVQ